MLVSSTYAGFQSLPRRHGKKTAKDAKHAKNDGTEFELLINANGDRLTVGQELSDFRERQFDRKGMGMRTGWTRSLDKHLFALLGA